MIGEEFMWLSDSQQTVPRHCCRVSKVFKAGEAWITFAFDHRLEGQRMHIAVTNFLDDMGWAKLGEAPALGELWTRRVLMRLLEELLKDQEDQEEMWGICWRIQKRTIVSASHWRAPPTQVSMTRRIPSCSPLSNMLPATLNKPEN